MYTISDKMKNFFITALLILLLTSCGGAFKPKKVNTREVPINAEERARKNVEEGRGANLKNLIGTILLGNLTKFLAIVLHLLILIIW